MNNKLKDLIKTNKTNIDNIVKETHIGKTTLYQIINGKSIPSVKYALILAKYFNISVEELFLFNEN